MEDTGGFAPSACAQGLANAQLTQGLGALTLHSQKLRVTGTPQNLSCPSVSEGGWFWDTPRQIPNPWVLTPPAARQATGSRNCGLPATGGNQGQVLRENIASKWPVWSQGQLRFLTAEVFPSRREFTQRAQHPAPRKGRLAGAPAGLWELGRRGVPPPLTDKAAHWDLGHC